MPYAAMLTRYGLPDMLAWSRAAPPGAGPGQIRIRVHAAEVIRASLKLRRRDLRQVFPLRQSAVLGCSTIGAVHTLGLAITEVQLRGPHERLGLHKLRLEVSSCSVQELTALDTDQSSRGPRVP
jgi:NADPH:quinone reductase-like Zn-dependent oxidoreductase